MLMVDAAPGWLILDRLDRRGGLWWGRVYSTCPQAREEGFRKGIQVLFDGDQRPSLELRQGDVTLHFIRIGKIIAAAAEDEKPLEVGGVVLDVKGVRKPGPVVAEPEEEEGDGRR